PTANGERSTASDFLLLTLRAAPVTPQLALELVVILFELARQLFARGARRGDAMLLHQILAQRLEGEHIVTAAAIAALGGFVWMHAERFERAPAGEQRRLE